MVVKCLIFSVLVVWLGGAFPAYAEPKAYSVLDLKVGQEVIIHYQDRISEDGCQSHCWMLEDFKVKIKQGRFSSSYLPLWMKEEIKFPEDEANKLEKYLQSLEHRTPKRYKDNCFSFHTISVSFIDDGLIYPELVFEDAYCPHEMGNSYSLQRVILTLNRAHVKEQAELYYSGK